MTVTVALPFTLINGTVADATQVMANFNSLVTGFTQAASAGANSDITALNGLLTPITPAQGGSNVYIGNTVAGTANAITVGGTTPANFTFTQGYGITFIPVLSNTGATTLTVLATGAQTVVKISSGGVLALQAGDIQIGSMAYLISDGTKYILLNPALADGGFGFLAGVGVVGTTLDLGAGAPAHWAEVFGGTITSFGSSADVTAPHYLLKFGAPTNITYNAVSLITPGTANIAAQINDVAELMYLGAGNWQIINYVKATGAAIVNPAPLRGANGLVLTAVGSTLNIAYSADSAVLISQVGNVAIHVSGVTGTINTGTGLVTPTADGMDGEATPVSAWGFIYLISNGTTTSGICSTNAGVPALPAGYSYYARVGAMRFSGAGQLMAQQTAGAKTNYFPTAATNTLTFPQAATQAGGVLNWPAIVPLATFVPPTATHVQVLVGGTTNVVIAISSSGQTGGNLAAIGTNPSELVISTVESRAESVEIALNGGTNIFAGAVVGGGAVWTISVVGWRDKVNAN